MPEQDCMRHDYTRVEVHADGQTLVGGERIPVPGGMDPYSAAIRELAGHAASSGSPVLAQGVDRSSGQHSWFTVDQHANAVPAEAPPASPTAPSSHSWRH